MGNTASSSVSEKHPPQGFRGSESDTRDPEAPSGDAYTSTSTHPNENEFTSHTDGSNYHGGQCSNTYDNAVGKRTNTTNQSRKRKFEDSTKESSEGKGPSLKEAFSPPRKIAKAAVAFTKWTFEETMAAVTNDSSRGIMRQTHFQQGRAKQGDDLVGREVTTDGTTEGLVFERSTMLQPQERNVAKIANLGQAFALTQNCPLCGSPDAINHKSSCSIMKIKLSKKEQKRMVKKITKVTADSKKKKHRGSAGKNYMLTAESICLLLQSAEPTHSTSVAPRPMEVLIHYVVGLCPELYTNSNVPVQSPQNYQRLDWYKDTFLAGPRQFVFQCPRQSAKNSPPSPKYAIVSESKIGLIRWELLEGSNVWLRCSRCNDECVCDRLERITPVFDGQGKPMYLASYVYKCRQCALEISGISQEFITRLPLSIQQVFPCPPHWIKPGFRFLVTSSLASLIRDLLDKNPEHGAERVENYLHQMYDCMYTMDQARYLVACGGETSADRFPTFEEWFGPSMQIPTADELNELYDFAKEASSGTTVGLAPE